MVHVNGGSNAEKKEVSEEDDLALGREDERPQWHDTYGGKPGGLFTISKFVKITT